METVGRDVCGDIFRSSPRVTSSTISVVFVVVVFVFL